MANNESAVANQTLGGSDCEAADQFAQAVTAWAGVRTTAPGGGTRFAGGGLSLNNAFLFAPLLAPSLHRDCAYILWLTA